MTCTHPTRSQGSGAMSPLVINGESLIQRSNPIHTQCKLPMPMISEIVHHTYIVNELCVVHLVRARRMGILQSAETLHSFRCPSRQWRVLPLSRPLMSQQLSFIVVFLAWVFDIMAPCTQTSKKRNSSWRTLRFCHGRARCPFQPTGYFGVVIRMAMDMDVSF